MMDAIRRASIMGAGLCSAHVSHLRLEIECRIEGARRGIRRLLFMERQNDERIYLYYT